MDVAVKIDIAEAEKAFSQFPINADKVVLKAMRKGATAAVKSYRATGAPAWALKAVGSKVNKGKKDKGAFGVAGAISKGKQGNWLLMRAYWSNFGTLENRDNTHQWSQARKDVSAKWKGGIVPRRWITVETKNASAKAFLNTFEKEYKQEIERLNAK